MAKVGIRREDKSAWERRTPLVPDDVGHLVHEDGLEILVQRAPNRCFPDDEYARAGAVLTDDLAAADVVLGVKEIPAERLEAAKAYMFFSHTMKGQSHNMPMLRRLLELGGTLLDYELVVDERGLRTIAFGRHAGLAGAIDTLWALGRRFAGEGRDTPFARIRQAFEYGELAAAHDEIRRAGAEIARGLPAELSPLAIGVTGAGGRVSGGALEVLELLPARRVDPDELAAVVASQRGPAKEILLVSYGPEHLVEPIAAGASYDWDDYVAHPERYRSRFAPHLALLTALVHGIFWREGYPRFILRKDLAQLWSQAEPRLRIITDVTCDPGGSNESLVHVTDPGNPMYVFDPVTGETTDGCIGRGPVVLPVDIFPAELPRDASRHFSSVLAPLVPALAGAAGPVDPSNAAIPAALRGSFIAFRGKLLPRWEGELREPLRAHGEAGAETGA